MIWWILGAVVTTMTASGLAFAWIAAAADQQDCGDDPDDCFEEPEE